MNLLAAAFLPDHMACRGLRLKHRALQVDVDHVVEILFGGFGGLLLALHADRVDQNVEPSEMCRGVVHHALRFGHRHHVEGVGVGVVAQIAEGFGRCFGLLAVVAGDCDFGARRGQCVAYGVANPAVPTCNQGDLAVQSE
jgi:hypothetical protein